VEKKNDEFRRYFHRKMNRGDACYSLLLVEKRRETLQELKRNKRLYYKRNTAHWEDGGKSEVVRKIPRISKELDPEISNPETCNTKQHLEITLEDLTKLKAPRLAEVLQQLQGGFSLYSTKG
jgi:hypothetical protein